MSSQPPVYVAIVDDDEQICRSLGRLLRASHIQAVPYPSAEAFLADSKHPHFDCLILEVHLEGISGIELRNRLHAVHDSTPVIFVTADPDPGIRRQAEDTGCAGFFQKIDSGSAILGALASAIGGDGRRRQEAASGIQVADPVVPASKGKEKPS